MEQTAAIVALVYAVAGSAGAAAGDRVGPAEPVPAAAVGLLLPGRGVVQLAPGTRARAGEAAGHLVLVAGRLRAVAERPVEIEAGQMVVRLGAGSTALVWTGPGGGLCAEAGRPTVLVAGAVDEVPIEPGTCSRLEADRLVEAGQLEEAAVAPLRGLAGSAPPRRPELPSLVDDPREALARIETASAEQLERGGRQEAAACGCSEGGGGGGSLDTGGGGGPSPEPEPVGRSGIRLRLRVPTR